MNGDAATSGYLLDWWDGPLLVEALTAYAVLMRAEAASEPTASAALLHAEQSRRADEIVADLMEQMRQSEK